MSTYWGYKCRKCGEYSGRIWNHGKEDLRIVAQNSGPLVEARKVSDLLGIYMISVECHGYETEDPINWLSGHLGENHEVVLMSEYGDEEEI